MQTSGKFVLRAGPRLHQKLKREAQKSNHSLNAYCVKLLKEGLGASGDAQQPQMVHRFPFAQDIVGKLCENFGDAFIGLVLFGSTARAEETESSDVDLFIVLDRDLPVKRECYAIWDKSVSSGVDANQTVEPHFVNLPETIADAGSLWYEVSIDGIILWERDRRLFYFLTDLRRYIAAGNILRKVTHGQPYWITSDEK